MFKFKNHFILFIGIFFISITLLTFNNYNILKVSYKFIKNFLLQSSSLKIIEYISKFCFYPRPNRNDNLEINVIYLQNTFLQFITGILNYISF